MQVIVSILEPVQDCFSQIYTLEDAHCAIEVCLDEISNVFASLADELKILF